MSSNLDYKSYLKLDHRFPGRANFLRNIYFMNQYLLPVFACRATDKMIECLSVKAGSRVERIDLGRYFLCGHSPLRFLVNKSKSRWQARCPLRVYLIYIFITFTTFWFTMTGFFQLQYGKTLGVLPKDQPGSNITSRCALPNEIYIDQRIESKLKWLKSRMLLIGIPTIAHIDLGAYALFSMIILLATLVLGGFYLNMSSQILWLDSLGFILDPVRERFRFRSELNQLMEHVMQIEDKQSSRCDMFNEEYLKPRWRIRARKGASFSPLRIARHRSYLMPSMLDQSQMNLVKPSIESKIIFSKFIQDEDLSKLIQPKNLSYKSFRRRCNIIYMAMIFTVTFGSVIFLIFVYNFVLDELRLRTRQRIQEADCSIWNPAAIPRQDPYMLEPIDSPEERKAYLAYDGSLKQLISLAINYEFGRFMSNSRIYTMALIFVEFCIIAAWMNNFVWNFVSHLSSMFGWSNQVLAEMDTCIKLLDQFSYLESARVKVGRLREVEKALAIAYIQFELYRRDMKDRQLQLSFNAFHIVGFISSTSLAGYLVLSAISTSNRTFIRMLTYFTILAFNVFLLICIKSLNQVRLMIKKATSILAKICSNSLETSYISALWRRQLLRDKDIQQLYAVRLAGIRLSHSTLISFNTYLFGLWLFILRPSKIVVQLS